MLAARWIGRNRAMKDSKPDIMKRRLTATTEDWSLIRRMLFYTGNVLDAGFVDNATYVYL